MKVYPENVDTIIISEVKRVLSEESSAIERLMDLAGEAAIKVVKVCDQCEGKVILTGMGKSGHVARKISATFASLGVPSFFLHPAEAAHGDLGMVQERDVVIMLSNSGETEEILQLVNSFKLIGAKLIGVFCKPNSTIGKFCDLSVILPISREACIHNLAPTTSTTAMMAFGDAVAVTLSKINQFKDSDFAVFHPKGALGKKLLVDVGSLNKLPTEDIAVVETQTLEDVLWVITRNGTGAVAVIDEAGSLLGLITDGDIRRCARSNKNFFDETARGIMTKNPISVQNNELASATFHLMQKNKISVVPLLDEQQKLCGLVSFHDIVAAGIKG